MPGQPSVPEPREPRYSVEWRPAAVRALRKLDKQAAMRITARVSTLADQPRPADVKALVGLPGTLRIRVGDYRVVYQVHDRAVVVLILAVGHRGCVYRRL